MGIFHINEKSLLGNINPDDVESIYFVQSESYIAWDGKDDKISYGELLGDDVEITDREIVEKIVNNYNDNAYEYLYNFQHLVRFRLSSGKVIYRNVRIGVDAADEKNLSYLNSVIGKSQDYVEAYFVPVPIDSVKYINIGINSVDSYSQSELKDVYEMFIYEYGRLSINEKNKIRLDSYRFETREVLQTKVPVQEYVWGMMRIKGRTDGENTIDNYSITDTTPQTANMFMSIVNNQNAEEFAQMIEDNELLGSVNITSYSVDFAMNTGTGNISLLRFRPKGVNELEILGNVLEIIKQNNLDQPTIYDNVIKLTWSKPFSDELLNMFLKVTKEEVEEIMKLTEIHS